MKARGTSRLKGFYRQTVEQRRKRIAEETGVSVGKTLEAGLSPALVDRMVENAVGVLGMPLGVATNFVINGKDVLVPMAIEEPSVIAAASNAARMAREGEGFFAEADPPLMAAQIEVLEPSPDGAGAVLAARDELLKLADSTQEELVSLGGGAREILVRDDAGKDDRLVIHLIVDCLDAMGANIVNTMAEAVCGRIAELAGGRAGLRILTNLADRRVARARCAIPFGAMKRGPHAGEVVSEGVVAAYQFAADDPYRAATHNKGAFNGIDAVLLATGNDWRAVEAGGHAYASQSGRYSPLSTWRIEDDRLCGDIALPMAVGIVGGASRAHPVARMSLDIMGVETAAELACITASVGLASNLAALAALATEGIQFGHMRLHLRKSAEP